MPSIRRKIAQNVDINFEIIMYFSSLEIIEKELLLLIYFW